MIVHCFIASYFSFALSASVLTWAKYSPTGKGTGRDQAVKRNIERFPPDFMFRLTEEEWDALVQKISEGD